jgi:hypothetical protein
LAGRVDVIVTRRNVIESCQSTSDAIAAMRSDIAALRALVEPVKRLDTGVYELTNDVRTLCSASEASEHIVSGQAEELKAFRVAMESAQTDSKLMVEGLSRCEAGLRRLAAGVGEVKGLAESTQSRLAAHDRLEVRISEIKTDVTVCKQLLVCPGFDSLIVTELAPIFDEFRGKRFTLLWRGSRGGFGYGEFHRRSDGHANTLTLILDTDGNIFGGFTPVTWESQTSTTEKADDTLRSFLFTLKNPHNHPARRFPLTVKRKAVAIDCNVNSGVAFGPVFGGGDLGVRGNCNEARNNWSQHGTRYPNTAYENDTTVEDLFTGSRTFQVQEIEVFEIIH